MKKATVIVGAGASAGVSNGTTPVTNRLLQPPLARELFDARFWDYRQRHRGAEVLGADLGPLAQRQDVPFDLEARLTEYRDSSDPPTRRAFKDIPPYLRDVLVAASQAYVPSPGNYLRLTARLLRDKTHEMMFVTLNYDTMLEKALAKYDTAYTFTTLGHYMAHERQAKVAKIHGSTNWGIPLFGTSPTMDNPHVRWEEAVSSSELPSGPADSFLIVESPMITRESWRDPSTNRLLYPVLTAPVVDKTSCCPPSHWEPLKVFLQECHKFLVIGTSGIDNDLLELLSGASPPDQGNVIYYVSDTVAGTTGMRDRFEAGVSTWKPSGPRTPLPREFVRGFLDFMDGDGVEEFLAAD